MVRMVDTLRGPIHPDKLGVTLMHEHIVSAFPGWFIDYTRYPFDRAAAMKEILQDMADLKAAGISSYLDASICEAGRDIKFVKEVAERTDVNIIAVTGFYTESAGVPAYFKYSPTITDFVAEARELMEMEVTQGMEGTGAKAGAIKLATGFGTITDYEKAIFTAAARVQKATGVPIITHTERGTMGPEQVDLLVSEGGDVKHIMIGHADSGDISYYVNILKRGAYLGFDRFGMSTKISGVSDDIRSGCMIALIGMGYVNQLVVGHDRSTVWVGKTPFVKKDIQDWNHTYFHRRIIPILKKAGVTDSQINTILVDNPRRFFGGK